MSVDYSRYRDPNHASSGQGKKEGWRYTQTLKCGECGEGTRHALLRPNHASRDIDEAYQRYALGGEWEGNLSYAPDRDRLRAEYFAKFPRNPKLAHRFWKDEAVELQAKGETHMAAICGAIAEIPTSWSTTERDPGELIPPDYIDWDTEFEDPETGLWWVDMDCVDCLRFSNNRTALRVRESLESWLSWFASHPDQIPDDDARALYGAFYALVQEIHRKKQQ